MKKKNRMLQNRCTIRGEIVDMEPVKGIRAAEDLYLLVETTLPDGDFTDIPCMVAGEKLKDLKAPLKEGDWVTVSGWLVTDKKEKLSWIEARMVDPIESEADQVYVNFAAFQGEIQEGSFQFHHGRAVLADFVLGVRGSSPVHCLDVNCLTDIPALHDFCDCLSCGEIQVYGKLDFTITDDGVIRCFADVSSISPVHCPRKEEHKTERGCENDS
ncbi:MAG: hypothetical protein J6S50_10800 [Oscillospiraceae bacterium]|nr:hypothetical protein [Oscillospiraceae bacterium]